ncbi:MAG: ABC transporter permease [Leptolyngbya sp. PLA3]|nr:MAG: ABC transporter permease [Cyanobacteria bacterium CYA]MCE7967268.1 ABC transporter permease [Leptolyngbya sp. PL-A3]
MSGSLVQAALPAPRPCSVARNVIAFARREVRDAVSSRWFVLCTGAFALLAVGVSFMSLAGSGSSGFAGFGRTAAGLLNMIMLIVPLMALAAGAGSIAGERERGTLLYLLAQPVSRLELLLGKYLGLGIALTGSLCIGFGLSTGVLAAKAGGADAGAMLALVASTCLLAWVMLGVGMVISVVSRKVAVATGVGLFVWLALVFVSDLGLMAGAIVFKLRVQELFILAMLNPLQAFKMGVIVQMNASLDVLGPAGMYASQTYGNSLPWMLVGVLLAWGILALAAAAILFTRKKSI